MLVRRPRTDVFALSFCVAFTECNLKSLTSYVGGNVIVVPFGTSVANSTESEWSIDVLAGGDDGDNDSVVTVTGAGAGAGFGVGVEFARKLDEKLVDANSTPGGSSLPVSFNSITGDIFIRLFTSTGGSYSEVE